MSEEQTESVPSVDPEDPGMGEPDPGIGTVPPIPYHPPLGSDG